VVSPMELVERVKDLVRGGGAGLRTVAVPAPRNGGDGTAAAWTGGVHFLHICFGFVFSFMGLGLVNMWLISCGSWGCDDVV
jgi:hypothetical protein